MRIGAMHIRRQSFGSSDRVTTRRQLLIATGAGCLLVTPCRSFAQHSGVPRIGLLWIASDNPPVYLEAFRQGLRGHGYIEGKNILLEDRFVVDRYGRLPDAAKKLVREQVDVILSYGVTATAAASKATSTVPIVMLMGTDPVQLGVAASLSKPGRNVTGIVSINADMAGKRLELLREVVPGVQRVAVVLNPESQSDVTYRQSFETAAQNLRLEVRAVEVRVPDDIDSAIAAIAKLGVSGIAFAGSTLFNAHQNRVVAAVAKTRLPAVYASTEHVLVGGLMGYAASQVESFRRLAYYIDRILKGTKPSALPIERPTKFELVVNMQTAKTLGITIPQSILVRADRVIE
jgi:putative tryptophan/tyrosine transport system substrate-binding protein